MDHRIGLVTYIDQFTHLAIFIGLTYSYLPFMILPLYASLERMDLDLAR